MVEVYRSLARIVVDVAGLDGEEPERMEKTLQ